MDGLQFWLQGGVDEQEVPRDAAIRELREETGVTSAEIIAEVSILQFVLINICYQLPAIIFLYNDYKIKHRF